MLLRVLWIVTTPVRMVRNVWMLAKDQVDGGVAEIAYACLRAGAASAEFVFSTIVRSTNGELQMSADDVLYGRSVLSVDWIHEEIGNLICFTVLVVFLMC